MRYFLELSYKGTHYSGFQIQHNAITIQSEVEKAFEIFFKRKFSLTGSSRTDAGVHALQNYFHFDSDIEIGKQVLYNLNSILPADIVLKNIAKVRDDAHCRFDAIEREYNYFIYQQKNPFLSETAYYYPYSLEIDLMNEAAEILKQYNDFTSFSKRNTQVKTFLCEVKKSEWVVENETVVYHVIANRFLRGMVRALSATMLQVGRKRLSLNDFADIIEARDCTFAKFDVPACGLFLKKVSYTDHYFNNLFF